MMNQPSAPPARPLRCGMVGMGMIFTETYRPLLESLARRPLYERAFGVCEVELAAVATRTGERAERFRQSCDPALAGFRSFSGARAVEEMLASTDVDCICIASPDDQHFLAAKAALAAGKHVLIEKPSVLSLAELDELIALAQQKQVLAKVVYHKLLDPDHKRLRSLVAAGVLRHVNNGYCTLLEPRMISREQFSAWIAGRNPGTYVAVHYIKLIDFTFGGTLARVTCTGQRGQVSSAHGSTWDSVQLRLTYKYADERTATFDIHTSWVAPDNFPGYVDQEVQFRFDTGVWNAHSRRRGVECVVERPAAEGPSPVKVHLNNHYNAPVLEPWNEHAQRGYGIEAIERFLREVATVERGGPAVEHGGPGNERADRLQTMRALDYNDLSHDRQTVAAVAAMEAILAKAAAGKPDCVVLVNDRRGGLVLLAPGETEETVLYTGRV